MKKIMFLYHEKAREYEIITLITQQIKEMNSNVEIRNGEFYSSIYDTIQFMPDVIVSIPPRDCYSSNYLTVLKLITRAIVISMSTEGYYVFSPKEIQMVIGYNTYAKELIDYYIMWGPKTKDILGKALLKAGKTNNMNRVKAAGYVLYETEKLNERYKKSDIYLKMQEWLKQYKKTILVLTGFLVADNTIDEYQVLGYFGDDTPLNKRSSLEIEQARESIAAEGKFRKKYIDMIASLAKNNPDVGIVVKLHPIEIGMKVRCYNELTEYSNIMLVKETVPVGIMLNSVDCMIHYNSTCNLEAYIYKVPTIQIYDDSNPTSFEFVWQLKSDSTYLIDICDFSKLDDLIKAGSKFIKSKSMEQTLFDLYNWKAGKTYRAIEKNAYYISNAKICQRLKYRDPEVFKAVSSDQGRKVIKMLLEDILLKPSGCENVLKDIYALFQIYKYIIFHKLLCINGK